MFVGGIQFVLMGFVTPPAPKSKDREPVFLQMLLGLQLPLPLTEAEGICGGCRFSSLALKGHVCHPEVLFNPAV